MHYLCPSSESGEQELESILGRIQASKDQGRVLQESASRSRRRVAEENAKVESLKQAISRVASEINKDRDLAYAIDHEREILSGLKQSDQQARIGDLEKKKIHLISEELVQANAEMLQLASNASQKSIELEKTKMLLDQLQVSIVIIS